MSRSSGPNSSFNGIFPEEIQGVFNQLRNNLRFLLLGVGVFVIAWGGFSGFYTVEPTEEAVVTRFGKYIGTYAPGLHFKLPFGVDRVKKVKAKLVLQEEFGFRTQERFRKNNARVLKESRMLTGDLNVAIVEWIIQYQIADPRKYLFNTQNPIRNIRDISEAIMRRVVGDRSVNDALTTGRVEIASEAEKLTQEVFDRYDLGVRIVTVKLQNVNPPELVKASFNEVNAAKQEQEQAINMAEKEYNKVIPEARGKAQRRISEAEGYAIAVINQAKGNAQKFLALLKEHQVNPLVTQKRLYIETMEKIFSRLKVIVVDPSVKGIMPLFTNPENKIEKKI